MVKGSGMRIKVGADFVHIDAAVNHEPKRLDLSFEGSKDEAHLLFSGVGRVCKSSGVLPMPQAKRRRQGQPGPSLDEVLGGSEVAVDESVIGNAVGRSAGVNEHI